MKLSDFDYHLPEELIAQYPPEQRAGGRLLDVTTLMRQPEVEELPHSARSPFGGGPGYGCASGHGACRQWGGFDTPSLDAEALRGPL